MTNERMRHHKATELKLLLERTKLQRRIDEAIATPQWSGETMQELNQSLDRLETELHSVRGEMRRLEREDEGS